MLQVEYFISRGNRKKREAIQTDLGFCLFIGRAKEIWFSHIIHRKFIRYVSPSLNYILKIKKVKYFYIYPKLEEIV